MSSSLVISPEVRQTARDLLNFIDASPSPWHAVAEMESQLLAEGFSRLYEAQSWSLVAGGCYYVIRDDSSIIAFVVGKGDIASNGFRIIGAHTDSPGFRVKPKAATQIDGMMRLGVEVYGGPILATFADRDLSIAGRVSLAGVNGQIAETRLVNFESPILRLPNLAIHMNREVNSKGLVLDAQQHLPLILGMLEDSIAPEKHFKQMLAEKIGSEPEQIQSWELNVYDTQKGAFFGLNDEFLANGQLDNLASCHAGLTAMLAAAKDDGSSTAVAAFFDHEEIGSTSHKGADSSFLPDVLERISESMACSTSEYARARANSFLISADMAHAWQPSFSDSYEPDHRAIVNQGPVIKINANVRYASEAVSQAFFADLCQKAQVPHQVYSHHCNLPCGSTIGPMTASRLGIRTVDVGNPMWAMHSARESAGVLDHEAMIRVMARFYRHSPIGV